MTSRISKDLYDQDGATLLAKIVDFTSLNKTKFLSGSMDPFQLGVGVVGKNKKNIKPHIHFKNVRKILNTTEFIMVLDGKIEFEIFNERKILIDKGVLYPNMGLLQFIGGHSFVMEPETRYFELKQGPYMGQLSDKEYFN